MSNKIIQINFNMEDPLDKTLWEYLKNLPKESRRQFVLQSLLLNMHLPPIYQVCFLQQLIQTAPNGINYEVPQATPTELPPAEFTGVNLNEQSEPPTLDRTQFAL